MNVAPFVIDIGTNLIKSELAGSDHPQIHRTEVGYEKYSRILPSSSSSTSNLSQQSQTKLLLGKELDSLRSVSRISHPIQDGGQQITNKQELESLLRYIIVDSAKLLPTEHAFLLTEAVSASDAQRKQLAEFLFEDLHCSSLLFGVQPVLSLHATGRNSGIVVECGAGVSQSCAIYEGYCIRESCSRIDFGGNNVTRYLKTFLREEAPQETVSSILFGESNNNNNSEKHETFGGDWEILQQIKHRLGSVSLSTKNNNKNENSSSFELPDGSEVSIPKNITSNRIGELYFSNSGNGEGIHLPEFVVRETLKRTDMSLRSKLCESVHLTGGVTLMPNFAERFAMEFAQLIPSSNKVKLHAANGRENAAWIGGSLICQMSSNQLVSSFGVTRSQYLEDGTILKTKLIG